MVLINWLMCLYIYMQKFKRLQYVFIRTTTSYVSLRWAGAFSRNFITLYDPAVLGFQPSFLKIVKYQIQSNKSSFYGIREEPCMLKQSTIPLIISIRKIFFSKFWTVNATSYLRTDCVKAYLPASRNRTQPYMDKPNLSPAFPYHHLLSLSDRWVKLKVRTWRSFYVVLMNEE